VLVTVVGIVLVIALVTLPVAIAGRFSGTLWHTMLLAAIFSILLILLGLAVSYGFDFPAGATTILIAGAAYLIAVLRPGLRRASRG
jgi:zinc transport system permease protein